MTTLARTTLLAFVALSAEGQGRPAPRKTEVAPGVFLFQTAPYGDVGLDGNSIAILSNAGVLVFDTNGTPGAAAAVLAEIRTLTDQPVRYVVNSHWHWDHWYGTEVYQDAFPDLQVIAHQATRRLMQGPALEFNRPGLETQLPGYLKQLEKRIADRRAADASAPDVAKLETLLAEDRAFLAQKAGVRHTFPGLTFSDRLDIHLGDRLVQVLHQDRAVTPGDAFLYLPAERIVITGDLLVNPISFALSCYPTGWLRTLEAIDSLDAALIVPGHGDPLRAEELLHTTMSILRTLQRRGREEKARGLDPDQARAAILPELREPMLKLTKDDPALNRAFAIQLVDWFLHRVYDELEGPLSDAIAKIPPS